MYVRYDQRSYDSVGAFKKSYNALVGLVLNQGDDHAVEVKEEQDEVETELGERFLRIAMLACHFPSQGRFRFIPNLLVHVQLPEDLGRVQEMGVIDNPRQNSQYIAVPRAQVYMHRTTYFLTFQATSGTLRTRGSQYPLIRNRKVRKPWTATSGMM